VRSAEGLVIGKFMPPHLGHAYLIRQAQAQVEHLTVVVFTKSAEPIPGHLRVEWLKEMCPGVTFRHVTAEHPVDFQSEAVWQLWIQEIRHVVPQRIDLVFSSETYGDELARRLGAQHRLVDPARQNVPVSSARVRDKPLDYWDYLTPGVRAYYAHRVAILGAESTGKTTLAQNLARHFNTAWVPEYARGYLEARGGVCTLEDMPVIARGQAAAEDRLARDANRLLICDTELLTTALWHERYWGWCPDEIYQMAVERAPRYRLFLLCDNALPWMDDGLRDSPGHREWFQQRFLEELQQRPWPYVVLSGSYAERTAEAVRAVEAARG
jgi:HTH-type transcriptional regulator, transcriptional repressor of NAD biosynthesis genes